MEIYRLGDGGRPGEDDIDDIDDSYLPTAGPSYLLWVTRIAVPLRDPVAPPWRRGTDRTRYR
jgi:hypothetical protein